MCESNVYLLEGDRETLLMENVGWMEMDGPRVLLKDMLGAQKVVHGRVSYADFVGHRIVLEPVEAPDDPDET